MPIIENEDDFGSAISQAEQEFTQPPPTARPKEAYVSDNVWTYEDYTKYINYNDIKTDTMSEESFNELAGRDSTRAYTERWAQEVDQYYQDHGAMLNLYRNRPIRQINLNRMDEAVRAEQQSFDDFWTTVTTSGEDEALAEEAQNVVKWAARLLTMEPEEGEDEESVKDARILAASLFDDYYDELQPHITAVLGEEWWNDHVDEINVYLPENNRSFRERFMQNAGTAWNSSVGQVPGANYAAQSGVRALSTSEQLMAHVVSGLRMAADTQDGVSAKDALVHSYTSGMNIPLGWVESVIPGNDTLGRDADAVHDGERYITLSDGRVINPNVNNDDHVSLREAVGISETELSELGERFASGLAVLRGGGNPEDHLEFGNRWALRTIGAIDTAGLAGLDPLSYVTMGSTAQAKAALRTLDHAAELSPLAAMARNRLRNGLGFAELSAREQGAVRGALEAAATEVFERGGTRNRSWIASWFRESGEEALTKAQVDEWTAALNTGTIPAIRFGGARVVPMSRIYNALGFINSKVANSAPFEQVVRLMQIEDPAELASFLANFNRMDNVPVEMLDQLRGMQRVVDMLEDPVAFTRTVLKEGEGSPQLLDEIEAFGRTLMGDSWAVPRTPSGGFADEVTELADGSIMRPSDGDPTVLARRPGREGPSGDPIPLGPTQREVPVELNVREGPPRPDVIDTSVSSRIPRPRLSLVDDNTIRVALPDGTEKLMSADVAIGQYGDTLYTDEALSLLRTGEGTLSDTTEALLRSKVPALQTKAEFETTASSLEAGGGGMRALPAAGESWASFGEAARTRIVQSIKDDMTRAARGENAALGAGELGSRSNPIEVTGRAATPDPLAPDQRWDWKSRMSSPSANITQNMADQARRRAAIDMANGAIEDARAALDDLGTALTERGNEIAEKLGMSDSLDVVPWTDDVIGDLQALLDQTFPSIPDNALLDGMPHFFNDPDSLDMWARGGFMASSLDDVGSISNTFPMESVVPALSSGRSLDEILGSLPLDDFARGRLAANVEMLENPKVWVQQTFAPSGLRGAAIRNDLFRSLSEKFSPRSGIRQAQGLREGDQAGVLDQVVSEVTDGDRLAQEHLAALRFNAAGKSKVYEQAVEEIGSEQGLWAQVEEALLAPGGVTEVRDRLLAEDNKSAARLVRTLRNIQNDTWKTATGSGFAEDWGRAAYIPRAQTEGARATGERLHQIVSTLPSGEAKDELSDLLSRMNLNAPLDPKLRRKSGVDAAELIQQEGRAGARGYQGDVDSILEVNEIARADLRRALNEAGVPDEFSDGFTLYEPNPMSSVLMRSRTAHRAAIVSDIVASMSNTVDDAGRPLAYIGRGEAGLARIKMQKLADDATFTRGQYELVPLPDGGGYLVRKEILDEMNMTRRIVGSQAEMTRFREFAETHNSIWAAFATVPRISFHARNATGNAFNMFVAGVTNPGRFVESAVLLTQKRRVLGLIRKYGIDYSEAVNRIARSQNEANLLTDLRTYDLTNNSQTLDLLRREDQAMGGAAPRDAGRVEGVLLSGAWYNPITVGRALGSMIEDQARVATYIDGISKGMTPSVASRRVRETLFDYGDLTMWEGDNARMVNRFYCVPTSHRALTRDGYRSCDELVPGETEMLVFDPEDHTTRWEVLSDVAVFDYDQEINTVSWHGRTVSFTDDHRWPNYRPHSGERSIDPYSEMPTGRRIPTNSAGHEYDGDAGLGTRLASILGWLASDGHEAKYQWFIYQKKQPYLDDIRALLPGAHENVHPDTGVVRVSIPLADRKALQGIGYTCKDDLPALAARMSAEESEAFMTALLHGDGHTRSNGLWSFTQKPGPVLDAFQIVAFTRGWRAWAAAERNGCVTVNLSEQDNTKLREYATREHFTGQVWCPQTPTGTWVMEHDGVVLPTGNTFTRKNTALQARVLATQPGRIANANRLFEEMQHTVMATLGFTPMDRDSSAPEWTDGYQQYYRVDEDGNRQVTWVDMETPFASFVGTMDLVKGLGGIPWSILTGDADAVSSGLREGLQLTAGGPVESLKYAVGMAFNRNVFTGRTMFYADDPGTRRNEMLLGLANLVIPAIGSYGSQVDRWRKEGEDHDTHIMSLANIALGLSVYNRRPIRDDDGNIRDVDPDRLALIEALSELMFEARDPLYDAGIEIPTFDELRDAGEVDGLTDVGLYMLYNKVDPTNLSEDDEKFLADKFPKYAEEILGLDVPSEGTADDPKVQARRTRAMIADLEAIGGELTETQIQNLWILGMGGGISASEFEDTTGIEGVHSNTFMDDPDTDAEKAAREAANSEYIEAYWAESPYDLETLAGERGVLSSVERDRRMMEEAGYTHDEMLSYFLDEASNKELMYLGYDKTGEQYTIEWEAEDAEKFIAKVEEKTAGFVLRYSMIYGEAPPAEFVERVVANLVMTKPDIIELGYEYDKTPRRENVTSDEQYEERRLDQYDAIQQVMGAYDY